MVLKITQYFFTEYVDIAPMSPQWIKRMEILPIFYHKIYNPIYFSIPKSANPKEILALKSFHPKTNL